MTSAVAEPINGGNKPTVPSIGDTSNKYQVLQVLYVPQLACTAPAPEALTAMLEEANVKIC